MRAPLPLTPAAAGTCAAQPEDIAAQTAKMERRANAGDKAKQAKIKDMKVRRAARRQLPSRTEPSLSRCLTNRTSALAAVQATLKASDTDAVKISKELWGKMNPSYDSSATRMMSAAQESVSPPAPPVGA